MKDIEKEIEAARMGFQAATTFPGEWFKVVNSCPYGPALDNCDHLAHAWYRGFWFFHRLYAIKSHLGL